ncbi:MAG TPA: hypothetical protein VFM18_03060 [Methanosarcina sp.]|nr:hypothetical protein [Methanosarcina sp.]
MTINKADVKVILMPPYLMNKDRPALPTRCSVSVEIDNVTHHTIELFSRPGEEVSIRLFHLRALARNKGIKSRLIIRNEGGGKHYAEQAQREPNQQPADITFMFPHKFD